MHRKPSTILQPDPSLMGDTATDADMIRWRCELGQWLADLRRLSADLDDSADEIIGKCKEMKRAAEEAEGVASALLAVAMGHATLETAGQPAGILA